MNALWAIMLEIIGESTDLCCPIKKIRVRNDTPAWFTKEVIELINTKREIMVRIGKEDRAEDHQLLCVYKRLVRTSLRKARQATIITSLEKNRVNPKRFRRILNKNLPMGKKSSGKECMRI